MPIVKSIDGVEPIMHPSVWIAENATVTGDVTMGSDCSVWYTAVIRGDVNAIQIGSGVNIQDGAIVHGSTGGPPTVIGDRVSVGHRAIIHGCVIEPDALIGMGAIVLDRVVVQSGSIVAAGAVVTAGTIVESGTIYAGIPARKIKKIDLPTRKRYIEEISKGYISLKDLQ